MSKKKPTLTEKMGHANVEFVSQGLLIQLYALSIKEQPQVDLSADKTLAPYQAQINSDLATAQSHADTYLNIIEPSIISNMVNIENYYNLHNAVPIAVPPKSTTAQWIAQLQLLENEANKYVKEADKTIKDITTLIGNLTTDIAAFQKTVTDMNTSISGDNGVLDSLASDINTTQDKINGMIAAVVVSGVVVATGVVLIVVGSVSTAITAGTSQVLVAGGIACVIAGVTGTVGFATSLKGLNDLKAQDIQKEVTLKEEIKIAQGVSSAYTGFSSSCNKSVNMASEMKNAWETLAFTLNVMATDLQNGILSKDSIRTSLLAQASGEVAEILRDIQTIKSQMAGITTVKVAPGEDVGTAIVNAAKASVTY